MKKESDNTPLIISLIVISGFLFLIVMAQDMAKDSRNNVDCEYFETISEQQACSSWKGSLDCMDFFTEE